jgi:hypothetical protein
MGHAPTSHAPLRIARGDVDLSVESDRFAKGHAPTSHAPPRIVRGDVDLSVESGSVREGARPDVSRTAADRPGSPSRVESGSFREGVVLWDNDRDT